MTAGSGERTAAVQPEGVSDRYDRYAWLEPGAHQVGDRVHRIPLPLPQDGLRAVNVYVLECDDDLVLIDGGWALDESRELLEHSLAALGHHLRDIARFLVTHAHRDHYTQAITVRREFGAHVSLGIGDRPSLDAIQRPGALTLTPQIEQLEVAGASPVIRALEASGHQHPMDATDWEYPDAWLEGQSTLELVGRELLAVPTPGHTPGHFVFADLGAGLLFAGDHVLPHITPSIGFAGVPGDHPLADYLSSLAVVRALPDMALLPAHGPVTSSTHERTDELVAHHEHRLTDCVAAVKRGAATAYEVARALTWTRHHRHFDELDSMNQMLAAVETLAHLDLLAAQNRLQRIGGSPGEAALFKEVETRASQGRG